MQPAMSLEILKEKLSFFTQRHVELKITKSRSTYLHLTQKERKKLSLSLHLCFLGATDEVLEALGNYLLKRDKISFQKVKIFVHTYFSTLDDSYTLDKKKLFTKGTTYDLQKIYEEINREYFDSSLNLSITYFPQPHYKKWRHITFGSYDSTSKLIRINDLLDEPYFPLYFVTFIVYHEALHSWVPSQIDGKGRRSFHGSEFRSYEKKFSFYPLAKEWEKNFLKNLSKEKNRMSGSHVRS
jgi:hypothetical protein